MIFLWRKQIGKASYFLLTVPVGIPFWDLGEHEPLTIEFFLPIISRTNWIGIWTVKGSEWDSGMARDLNTDIK